MEDYEAHDGMGLAKLVAEGHVCAEELLEAAIERVERLNPVLNAVVYRWYDEARAELRKGLPDGPFRGVPFLLKDLHSLFAGQPISQGSQSFEGFVPDHDTTLVDRYRRAGLVIFGRTASPEFGLSPTTESALHGKTHNPWDLARTPGGSSGGASACVAVGVLPLANASDGGGSIRIPASCCGVFGMKPTRGRNPAGPDVGEGWGGMSTAHVVTRSVRDCAAMLDATSGPDVGAPYWAPPPSRPFLAEVGTDPGRLRIGMLTEPFNGAALHVDCREAVEDAARLCETLGHTVEPACLQIDSESLASATLTVIASNVRVLVEDRASALGRRFGPEGLEQITYLSASMAGALTAMDYVRAMRTIHGIGRQVGCCFADYDVLMTPTMPAPPLELGRLSLARSDASAYQDDLAMAIGFTSLFNVSGNPAMSVPLVWNRMGLPIGIQFAGRYGDEAGLYRLAAQLERARPWQERRPDPAA